MSPSKARSRSTLPTGAATESTLSTINGKFPTAFASTDNIAAQTATAIHGFLFGWDSGGANWDRVSRAPGRSM